MTSAWTSIAGISSCRSILRYAHHCTWCVPFLAPMLVYILSSQHDNKHTQLLLPRLRVLPRVSLFHILSKTCWKILSVGICLQLHSCVRPIQPPPRFDPASKLLNLFHGHFDLQASCQAGCWPWPLQCHLTLVRLSQRYLCSIMMLLVHVDP